jgi:hypothetical protein
MLQRPFPSSMLFVTSLTLSLVACKGSDSCDKVVDHTLGLLPAEMRSMAGDKAPMIAKCEKEMTAEVRSCVLAAKSIPALQACKPAKADMGKPIEPTATATAPASPAPTPAAPTPQPAAAAPRKLAEVDDRALGAAAAAIGWSNKGTSGMTMGAYSSSTMTMEKAGASAKVTLVVPSGKPADPKSALKILPPSDQANDLERKEAAALVSGDAMIAVQIENVGYDDNKVVLDALVKHLDLAL